MAKAGKRLLTVERSGELLFDFFKAHEGSLLGPDVAMVLLDRKHDPAASALCRRIAVDPDLPLADEPPEVRALLCWRIATIIRMALRHPDGFPSFGPVDDAAARTVLFEHMLSAMSLHDEQHGQLLVSEPRTPPN